MISARPSHLMVLSGPSMSSQWGSPLPAEGKGRRAAGGFLAALALLGAALAGAPAEVAAQSVDFCSRTSQVVAEIRRGLTARDSGDWTTACTATANQLDLITIAFSLTSVTSLQTGDFADLSRVRTVEFISSPQLTSLAENPFDGLTSLRNLRMSSTGLTSLPTGMFDNLTNLSLIHLPGSTPFTLDVEAELHNGRVRARIDEAAPKPVSVTWTASGGSTATGTATIAAGSRTSAVFGTAAAQNVTIALSAPTFSGLSESTSDYSGFFRGFQLGLSSTAASATIPGTVTMLVLSPRPISENGGVSTVTAKLSSALSEAVTVTVTASAGTGAVSGDFTQTGTTLTIAVGETTSVGVVTVTANDNAVDSLNKEVTVAGTVEGGGGVAAPASVTLTITDDDAAPGVTLALSPSSIAENGGVATVTATLSRASSAETTVTVTGVSDFYTAGSDATIVIAAGETANATDTATVTAANNDTDAPDRAGTVTATVSNDVGAGSVSGGALTVTDDDAAPNAALSLNPSSVTENGGVSAVSATLTHPSSEPTTVTVTPVSGSYTVGSGAAGTIVIAAGSTAGTDTATITAVDNDVDAADNAVTVTATLTNSQGAGTVTGASLTITDDDTAGFSVSPATSTSSRLRTTEDGGTDTFTVELGSEPTGNVVLAVASGNTSEGTVSVSSLTFTDSTWSTAQTVTLTGVDDAPANPVDGDRNYTVTLTVNTVSTADATYDAVSAVTVYAVNADNEYGLDVSPVTGQATEAGGTAAFTVALNTRPSEAVTVSVTSRDTSEGAASPSSLTFTDSTWNVAQAVTVTGADDAIDDGDVSWDVRLDPSSGDANYEGLSNVDVSVTTDDDDDAPGVVLTVSPSSISETGGVATVTATLSRASGAATTVTVTAVSDFYTVGSDAVIVIAAGETAAASDTATVAAVDNDTDAPDRAGTVTATITNDRATTDGTTLAVSGGALTVTDDDGVPNAALSLNPSSVSENGGVSTVSATLTHPSSEPTTVTVTGVSGAYTVGPGAAGTIVIAAGSTANATDTATITAVDNDVDAADNAVTVVATLTNSQGAGTVTGASLTITDDDTAALVVSPTPSTTARLRTTEDGGTDTFTVELGSEPTGNVVLAVASGNTSEGTVSPSSLTFTDSTWSTAQTVTLTGVDDAPDNSVDGDQDYTVTLTVNTTSTADATYDAVSAVTVYAVNADNEYGLDVGSVTGQATEAGGTAAFTVALLTRPLAAVTVSVTSRDASEGTASPSSLTFTDSTWNVTQTVTVTGLDDAIDDGDVAWDVRLDPSSGDDNYDGLSNVDVSVTTTDDDDAPGVVLALSPASIAETGGVATVTATLSRASGAATTVTVTAVSDFYTVGSDAVIVIAAGSTAAASDTATVAAVDNDTDAPDRAGTVTATITNDRATTDGTTLAVSGGALTVTDDDGAPGVTLSLSASSISENGGVSAVSATLTHPSSAATTVTVTALSGAYTVGPGAAGTIVIAAGSTANGTDTATITAVDNEVDAADNAVTVTGTAANSQGAGTVTGASLTITDDDTAAVVVSPAPSTTARLRTTEDGGTDTFTVELGSEPTGNVVLAVASGNTSEGTVSVSSLTFTDSTWSTAQTVTLTGVDDAPANSVDGDQDYTVTLTVNTTSTADATYDALSAVTVYAVNADNEYGLDVGSVTGQATEAGGTAAFTVALMTRPLQAVTVTVTSRDSGEGTVSPSSLTFTDSSWNVTQTVTVTGVDDAFDDGDVSWDVRLDPSSGDANYEGLSNVDVPVTTTDDDDVPGVTLTVSPSSILESGGEATVTATLSRASSAATTVTVATVSGFYTVGSDAVIVIAAGETAAASDTATVTAVNNDTDAPDRVGTVTATITNDRATTDGTTLAVSGGALTVTDDDGAPGVTLSLSASSISENGGVSAVSATLTHPSSAATTVTVTALSGAYTVGPGAAGTIVIAAGSTANGTDTATITAVDNEVDAADNAVTVTGSAANAQATAESETMTVTGASLTITDDDTAAVVVSPAPSTTARLRTTEDGGTAAFEVELGSEPTGNVVLGVASSDTAEGTVSTSSLTFTDLTWSTAQTVTLTGVDDNPDDPVDGDQDYTVTLTVNTTSTADATYDALSAVMVYAVNADNEYGLDVGSVTGQATEAGGQATFTVALVTRPLQAVTVTVTSLDASEGTVSPSSLTFTDSDWDTTQAVTVTGVNDAIDDGDVSWDVRLDPSSGDANYEGLSNVDVSVTTDDDDDAPGVVLTVSPSSISESGGEATVTATLSRASGAATTVTVTEVSGFYTVGSDAVIVIAAGETADATDTATVAAVDNTTDAPARVGTVTATITNARATADGTTLAVTGGALTVTDDDAAPNAALSLNPSSVSENGGVSAVSATLTHPSSEPTTVTVAAVSGSYTVGSGAAGTIVIAAGSTAGTDTATITAVDNDVDAADNAVTVTGTAANSQGAGTVTGASLTITDDDDAGLDVGSLTGQATEAGGTATFTVALDTRPSEAVTVSVTSRDTGEGTVSPSLLTFETSDWDTAQMVTVTGVNDAIDDGDVTWDVRLAPSSGDANYEGLSNVDVPVTTTDDDDAPGVTLTVSPSSISESGGEATVTATLSRASGAATTVTVTTVSGFYTLGSDATIVIAAGSTAAASDTATIEAVNNTTDAPARVGTVRATVSNDRATADGTTLAVTGGSLTVTDDDAAPNAALSLDPASVSENGGASAVSATLTHPSSEPTTVTVTAVSGAYTVGSDATIVIVAGETTNETDTAAITAVDNTTDEPDRTATVTATLANGQGAGTVSGATLTLTDDDAAPEVTLSASPASISENGGVSTVTAELSHPSSAETTVTVTAVANAYSVASGPGATIVIAAGETATATDTATITAVDNDVDAADNAVTVTGTAANDQGAGTVTGASLTITDDDDAGLDVGSVTGQATEAGGTAAFTVALVTRPSEAVTVSVTSRDASEGAASPSSLIFETSDWDTAQAVTVTGVNDAIDDGDVSWDVRLDPSSGDANYEGLSNVDVPVTTTDDDAAPGVVLALSPSSISESGGEATVTATLSRASGAATTVTVTMVSGFYTVGSDATIVIAAGSTAAASDTATVAAVNNTTDAPDRVGTVTATITNDRATADRTTLAVTGGALTVTDDDDAPNAALSLDPSSVSENGGASAVSATLTHPSSEPTTVTVTPVSGSYTVGADATIVIAAGQTANGTDTAAIAAVDNAKDEPDRTATVTATLANSQGAGTVSGAALTLEDDDAAPGVTLSVADSAIAEDGGTTTVSAVLSLASSAETTVTVTPVSGAYTVGSGAAGTIVIAAGETANGTDTATITAVDNDVDAADNAVTVTGTAANDQGAGTVTGASLTITDDDDAGLDVGSVTGQATEAGGTATFTVALVTRPSEAVTVSVTSRDASEGAASPSSLIFETSDWDTAQAVTVTGVNDAIDDGDVSWDVRLDPSSGDANYEGLSNVDVPVTTTDDDDVPGVTLAVSPSSISEDGGEAAVTATLSRASSAATTVTVTAMSGFYTVGSDAVIVIAAGSTAAASDTAMIEAVNNTTDAPDRVGTVTATITNARATADGTTLAVTGGALTVTDDDDAPNAALSLNPSSVSENGGVSTVSATLTHPSSEPTTVTVTPVSGSYTVGSDATIVIVAGQTANATDTAAITAVDNTTDEPDRTATVTATLANGQGAGTVSGATLTLEDDDAAPGVTLSLSPASISENGGVSTVTAELSHPSSAETTVTVTAVPGFYTVGSDAAGTIVIAAGETAAASDTATVTAVNNATDAPDRAGTVTATVSNDRATADGTTLAVSGGALTVTDDDAAPNAALSLNPASVSENGGASAVSATLTHPSSEPTTVTVTGVSGSYTVDADATIVIAAGQTANGTDTAAIAAVDNAKDEPDRTATVTATLTNGQGAGTVTGATLTLEDDDAAGFAVSPSTSASSRLRTTEGGGTVAFEVNLESEPTGNVVLGVVSSDTTEGTVSVSSLTFTATTWSTAQTVTLTGVDDAPANPVDGDRNYTVTLTVNMTSTADAIYDALSAVTVYAVNADNEYGLDVGSVTGQATEGGGQATFTVALLTRPLQAVTVTVTSQDAGGNLDTSEGTVSPSSLTFTDSDWDTTQTVTVTGANDAIDDGEVTWNVRLDPSSDDANYDGLSNVDVLVTTTDDDDAPGVTLTVSPSSISENGGEATVTATLSRASGAATTVTVTEVSGFYTVGSDTVIVIAAGSTANATDTATIEAVNNATDAPDRAGTVTATVSNDQATADGTTMAVTGASLTVTDDDAAPDAVLSLNPASVSENGGASAVSATLTHPSSAATTVTVTAVSDFYTVGSDATIVIAAGQTANGTDTAAIAAVDNAKDEPDRTATVTATLANSQGTGTVSGATLTLTDDDAAPGVTLSVSPASISENGGVSTVTAELSHPSSAVTTVTVTGGSGSYTVGSGAAGTIVIAAGETANGTDTATITAVDNDVDAADNAVTVTGVAANDQGAGTVTGASLTITDDDDAGLDVGSLTGQATEAGGTATFTVALDTRPSEAVTVSVTSRDTGEGTVSPSLLTFETSDWDTVQMVTVTGVNDAIDDGDVSWDVRLDPSSGDANYEGLSNVDVPVTTTDDDDVPGVVLAVSPSPISEDGGEAAVTATLTRASSAATTVTVTEETGFYTVGSDATIVIAAGETAAASDTAMIEAVNNTTDAPDREGTVTATVSNGRATADRTTLAVSGGALTVTDDDDAPNAALSLNPASVSENGGVSTVSATLTHPSSEPTTVTVTAVSGSYMVGSDAAGTIVIAAGSTAGTDTATITAVDNDVDAADNAVTVTATLTNSQGAGTVTGASLTLTDDDTAALVVSPTPSTTARLRTTEDGGTDTFTVELGSEPTGDVVLSVASSNIAEGTVSASSLTFTDSTWNTAQTVTLTGVDDAPANPADGDLNYTVTLMVSQESTADALYDALSAVTVYAVNADNEYGLVVGSVTGQATEAGGTATFTVALQTRPSAAVTVSVTSLDTSEGAASPSSLTFDETSGWNRAQAVTVTGADDAIDDGDVTWAVRLDPSSGDDNYDGLSDVDVPVTTTDDDDAPGVVLAVSPSSIVENGGEATVTATLSRVSSAATTVTVTEETGFYTVGSDAVIVIAAGSTANASDTVTVTAVNNTTDAPDRAGTVTATVSNDRATADGTTMAVSGGALTVTDDDTAPNALLLLDPASISENGGVSMVTAELSHPSSAATTVTVTGGSGSYMVGSGAAGTIVIAAGETADGTDTATITAVNNDVDAADNAVTVTATLTNSQGAGTVTGAGLTITDDDTVALVVSPITSTTAPLRTTEDGETDTFTVELGSEPTGNVVLAVVSSAPTEGTVSVSSLTFTDSTWNETQTVTLTGVDDAPANPADGDRNYTVTLTVNQSSTADTIYGALPTPAVTVYAVNADNDATADVNEDGRVDTADVLVMYYTYTSGRLLEADGAERLRRLVLQRLRVGDSEGATLTLPDNDTSYMTMLNNARDWENNRSAGGDVNEDGRVDTADVLVMYYTYTSGRLLEADGAERLRRLVLQRLRVGDSEGATLTLPDTDTSYMTMLNNAKDLVTAFSTSP